MNVLIGAQEWYNSEDYPILLILSDEEKRLISEMGDQTRFLVYPSFFSVEEAERVVRRKPYED